jgi:O-antigen biosynthesis protein
MPEQGASSHSARIAEQPTEPASSHAGPEDSRVLTELRRGTAQLRSINEHRARLERELVRSAERLRAQELEHAAARRELERWAERTERAESEAELLRVQIQELRAQNEALQSERRRLDAEHQTRLREFEQTISALNSTLGAVKRDLERAENSRAWRWGHAVTTAMARVARRPVRTKGALVAAMARIERLELASRALPAPMEPASSQGETQSTAEARRMSLPLDPEQQAAVDAYRAALALKLRQGFGPPPLRARWPLVSIVVATRNGRHHLARLFAGLKEHTDYPAFEVIVVDCASRDGSSELLRSLELRFRLELVETGQDLTFSQANGLGVEYATGSLLLFLNNDVEPFEPGWLRELVAALDGGGVGAVGGTLLHSEPPGAPIDAEPLVQHRAIAFRWEAGTVRGFNVGDGEPLWDSPAGAERRCPAVTAACLLIARETFEHAGGFDVEYRFGTEDVDLGLKLVAQGQTLAGVGRSVLVHRESSTQNLAGSDFRRLNRLANRRRLLERWGAELQRAYRLGRLTADTFWTDGEGPRVAITLTSADVADGWGDWYTAHGLGDALAGLGWRVTYAQRRHDGWLSLPGDLDYVVSLLDSFDLRTVPDHIVTAAWIRNWTERWLERPWLARADLLLVSSAGSAELVESATGRPTVRFPLATDPDRFTPDRREQARMADYIVTGNRWGEERPLEVALDPRSDERVRVHGRGWATVRKMRPYNRGELSRDQLASAYASARLVLDDTQGPTKPYGALNARVFDALAAGTLALTDCEAGVRELFDEEYPVWSSAEDLRRAIDDLLGDDDHRLALADRYRRIVLAQHTYAHRAVALRELLLAQEQRASFAIKIGAPDREQATRWGDLHFAEALARELQRSGYRALVQTLDQWEDEEGLRRDVVVHLKGLSNYHPRPGQLNVLWSISHPADLSGSECDGYDLVAVASPTFAAALRERTSTPVVVLEQATDPRVFSPQPSPGLAHDLLYVANSRNVLRPIMRDLLPTTHDLAVYGANWEGLIDPAYVVADHVPNAELGRLYSSARIVLCDHWDDMRTHGYISNRIYDALACGAFVISDDVPGLAQRFGDAVVTYRTPQDLVELIDRFLADPDERRRRGAAGRNAVLESYTFANVTEQLLREIDRIGGIRRLPVLAGADIEPVRV